MARNPPVNRRAFCGVPHPSLGWHVKAIEGKFPFEKLSQVAEIESWRKELYRPLYYMHKWWARRLGSVFRAAILGAYYDETSPLMELLYEPVDLDGFVVFDPFMGAAPRSARRTNWGVLPLAETSIRSPFVWRRSRWRRFRGVSYLINSMRCVRVWPTSYWPYIAA
jgi:hypothetical protein